MSRTINIYDFDHTIYKGDCSIHFYLYSLRRKPILLKYLPLQVWHLLLFIGRFEKRDVFKANFFRYLQGITDIQDYVDKFWEKHRVNIKKWYSETDHSKDFIISASPEFLLKPITAKLKVRKLIATDIDPSTGRINGKNCRGKEKVTRLQAVISNPIVEKTFSDSLADLPILELAKYPYMVRGDKIMTLTAYKQLPAIKRLLIRK